MKSIVVFCGSSSGVHPVYTEIAKKTGELLAQNHIKLIYGAGNVGLMGVLADAALSRGGKVLGVIPYFLKEKELCHPGLTELHVVNSMHERKIKMAQLSDGVLVLPGGYGTLDELFEMLTLVQLGQEKHPVGILNSNGYFDHLIAQLYHMRREGFLREEHHRLVLVDDELESLLRAMEQFIPDTPVGKWWLDVNKM